MKTHYDTLGIPQTATHEEIKTAYRQLCMQTHPDVANATSSSSSSAGNADRFKQISEAYSILGNQKERRRYDYDIVESMRFGGLDELRRRRGGGAANNTAARRAASGYSGSAAAALPRNLFIGALIGITTVSIGRMIWPSRDDDAEESEDGVRMRGTGHKKLVEAWKNPATGRWETPAPWDPEYQRLQPALKFVPRKEVHDNKR